ncbi:hypothetical protein [Oceanobacillus manasiensis]|uniref:hypothetical protein n=1 Tax=Oceanobacillus manasiensis TaxID=586413 RepID=UPI000A5A8DA3|nr:hypothetical protein [Oceanobacillus manasiensis]
MERIIEQNKDEAILKYIVVTLFSFVTFKKVKRLEKRRGELKERMEQEKDHHRV